jgi:SAM-dependent methyltransferase
MLLSSMGVDARGIDLDAVSLTGSVFELLRVLRRNGVRRFIKTLVRSALFDSHERRALRRVLARSGHELRIDPERFLVGDVADYRLPPASLDIIYSEDVFEHIPGPAIEGVCQGMARALKPGGLAFVSPLVYSSLIGGHLSEWYGVKDSRPEGARSAPWEHLRQRRLKADCYLNEWRLADYQRAFGKHFEVLEVINLQPEFGSSFLDESIRRELSEYAEHELLGSKWRFVLRKQAEVAE